MKRYLVFFALLSGLLVFSCTDDKCTCPQVSIEGSGTTNTVTRTLPTFSSLALNAAGDVNITLGSTQSVSITVDDNVLEYVTTTVNGGTLEIGVDPIVRLSNYSLTVNITMTDLEAVVLNGSGTIAGQYQFELDVLSLVLSGSGTITVNVDTDVLSSVLSGSGSINLSGTGTVHSTVVSGSGAVHAFDLASENCAAVLSGSGIIEVLVNNSLEAVVSGSGTIYYRGDPENKEITITGSGRVEHVG